MARPKHFPAPRRKRDGGHLSEVELEFVEVVRKPDHHKPKPGHGTPTNAARQHGPRTIVIQNGR